MPELITPGREPLFLPDPDDVDHVTGGDNHDHAGGDGAQIDHGSLAGLGDSDHDSLAGVPGLDIQVDTGGTPKNAYVSGGKVIYTADGSFAKASYPGLRAVLVQLVGGGGGGGGAAATAAGERSAGAGGGGGGWAEELILASALGTSETVQVGVGGTGVSGAAGNNGEGSFFGTSILVQGTSGGGGGILAAASGEAVFQGGGGGGGPSGADWGVTGDDGGMVVRLSSTIKAGSGGGSYWAGQQRPPNLVSTNATAGQNYGGGGTGASNGPSQSARAGGAGADGLVIVELLY